MKKATCSTMILLALLMGSGAPSSAQIDIEGALDRILTGDEPRGGTTSSALIARGLKEALSIGIRHAIDRLGKPGGYLQNNRVRIPVPGNLKLVAATLRRVGQGEKVDAFVAAMNRAASDAVPAGSRIFIDAVRAVTIQDAVRILNGPDDAATTYFKRRTQDALTSAFLPLVKRSMESAQVIGYYNALNNAYQTYAQPLMKDETVQALASILTGTRADEMAAASDIDLDAYVTGKALDGLFVMIAEEEKKIREEPAARVTDLLERVFGSSPQ